MTNEHITRGEFGEWRREEAEFRARLEGRITNQNAAVMKYIDEMVALQREQNGRVRTNAMAIAIIQREIEAIKHEDTAIEKMVESIQKEGCHQYVAHEKVLEVLEGSGAALVASDGARVRAFSLSDLSQRQKVAAGVGVTALLIPAVGDLIRFLTQLVHWLETLSIH
jgi:hypothetical protein